MFIFLVLQTPSASSETSRGCSWSSFTVNPRFPAHASEIRVPPESEYLAARRRELRVPGRSGGNCAEDAAVPSKCKGPSTFHPRREKKESEVEGEEVCAGPERVNDSRDRVKDEALLSPVFWAFTSLGFYVRFPIKINGDFFLNPEGKM